ncbi:MAG TPA: penicillin-binding protein 2 [Verrucomicrobiota bacterium]|nr:penicillin-binding protein 2 [Verrucomicrobiota bacterium]
MFLLDTFKRNDPHLRLIALAVLAGLGVLLSGLWWVQMVRSHAYQTHLESQSLRTVRVPAVRGRILDRNGLVLAENRPAYNISLYLEDLRSSFDDVFDETQRALRSDRQRMIEAEQARLGRELTKQERRSFAVTAADREQIRQYARYTVASNVIYRVGEGLGQPLPVDPAQFKRHHHSRRALPYPVLNNLEPAQIARFEEQLAGEVGADLEIQSYRHYPNQTTAAHALGYLKRNNDSAPGEESFYDYRLPDFAGVVGVEGYFDQDLRGRAGMKSVLVNNLGYRQGESFWSEPQPGQDVRLTIDLRLQKAAEQALARRVVPPKNAGAVVIMDVHSGDILAMVSSPAFDPNDFAQGITPERYRQVQELTAEKNRATQENYAPGSIFKAIVGLACLEAGMNPGHEIYNPGHIRLGRRYINDTAPAGDYNFRRALKLSSNTYFITNGLRYAGIQNIIKLSQRFHLGERHGIPTWQETPGHLPSLKRVNSGWTDGDTANICIGQGEIAVTPLQMAVMTAALANGGNVLWPRLVDRIESQNALPGDEPTIFQSGRIRNQLGVNPRNLRILHEAMLADTEDPDGTGRNATVPGLKICGKTGTAQVTDVQNRVVGHTTWFVAFAPYEKPKYAVVVMIEGGSSGGGTCAPVARDIFTAIQKLNSAADEQKLAKAE